MSGRVGAIPYGVFAAPIGTSHWVAAAAFTPEILMRANWRYVDAPGTAGATYGLQNQLTQIMAVRSSASHARSFGSWWHQSRPRLQHQLLHRTTSPHGKQAFQQLPITLSGGTNTNINSVAGSTTLQDAVPLRWKNQGGPHIGVESPLGEQWTLRAGYADMSDPVPSSTLLPLTTAIMRNTLTTGAGWSRGHWRWDAAYQIQIRSSESVGKSTIRAGEYDNSRVGITLQSVTFTARRTF